MNSHGANRHARITVDLEAIRHNYRLLKKLAGGKKLIAVIKADAYGHGAIEVAKALNMADAFAVAAVGEAVALREAGIEQKIIVLGGFINATELAQCVALRLDPVIHQNTHLDCLQASTDLDGIDIWVKIDTGMGRLGFRSERVAEILQLLKEMPGLGQLRLMTHLASSDDLDNPYTERQLEAVKALQLDDYEWGIANSAGVLAWPQSHNNWVRAGIALYGANPLSNRREQAQDLKPAMEMKTVILAVNQHARDDLIGYGNTYQCPHAMKIAVIAAGYADGYPRLKVNTASVIIAGKLCDIVGRVSMDMITVDVSALRQVEVGDEVILFGNELEVNDLADSSQTIAYEVFCNVGAHALRDYLNIDEN